jgi:hypothetical protein
LAVEPAIEAVGVPLSTPVNANFADKVEDEPINKSTVLFFGYILPLAESQ